MRVVLAAVFVLGCGSDTPSVDADTTCTKAPPQLVNIQCVDGGIAAIDLNGTWTFTGTRLNPGSTMPTPISHDISYARDGTGWCHFGVPVVDEHGYADDTWAYWYDGPGGGVGTTYTVCVRTSDGALFGTWASCTYNDTLNCIREQGTLTR